MAFPSPRHAGKSRSQSPARHVEAAHTEGVPAPSGSLVPEADDSFQYWTADVFAAIYFTLRKRGDHSGRMDHTMGKKSLSERDTWTAFGRPPCPHRQQRNLSYRFASYGSFQADPYPFLHGQMGVQEKGGELTI